MRLRSFSALVLFASWISLAHSEHPFFAKPWLFGVHRGGAGWMPEHTLETYQEVARRWPDALLEMDVRLTKDGAVVLHHDATVDRTTDGTGPIEALTLDQVRELDAGYDFTPDGGETFPYRGQGFQIATLDEVLTVLPDARWLIEPKTDGPLVGKVAKVIKAHDAQQRVLIASFKPAIVEELKQLLPESPTCFTTKTGMQLLSAIRAGGETWTNYQPPDDVLSLSRGMVTQFQIQPEEISKIKNKGIKFQLHTLNTEPQIKDAMALGVDSILSDRPDVLDQVLSE